ncbi:hypothetical protein NBT05_18155 [Aquimarina sp. ERC-38]|uniref:hypothetical protein n=1 Tax=Aquimarina sp. ERC-38 TaxID=2949996 RepID=UPI002246C165|nr:hypothetical protein [Aquimarina sp. ERC-38]UZO80849.1 hypothetical protein NBT05_18155 [Aquimarina sp. ERC-38]
MPDQNNTPELPFLHMYTDQEGKSTIDTKILTAFSKESVGGKADPQYMLPFPGKVEAVKFAILPEGWVGDWHESPKKQWVIPTKGRWFIETQQGNRIEMGPGDIHFGEDLDTTEISGNRGHKSGTVGNEPCCMMIVQFEDVPDAEKNILFDSV